MRNRRNRVLICNATGPSVVEVYEINRSMLIVYAAAALAIALIGARYIKAASGERSAGAVGEASSWSFGDRGGGETATGTTGSTAATKFRALVVHVAGAVRRPGIVRLRDGDRTGDAVAAAGGPTARADLNAINLAMRLADGQQVVVPARAAAGTVGSGAAATAGQGPGGQGPGSQGPISLGSATVEQLDTLDGVGPGLAAKIIAYRTEHGGFRSIDELAEVPGIGDKRLESLRAQLQP